MTFQRLVKKIDAGHIIAQKFFKVYQSDTLRKVRERIYNGSVDLASIAFNKMADEYFKPEKLEIEQLGDYYTLPNFTQWIYFHLKVLKRNIFHL